MTGNEYQKLAMRTAPDISDSDREKHALHGIVSEAGEIHGLYQKVYQGHTIDKEHAKKELGDLMWFVAEYADANGWKLSDIMQMNIDKLKARYPQGFDSEKSLHRKEGDI